MINQTISHFKITEKLGEGGWGSGVIYFRSKEGRQPDELKHHNPLSIWRFVDGVFKQ